MMKLIAAIFMLFATPSAFADSSTIEFPQNNLAAKILWEQGPFNEKESAFLLQFTDLKTGQPSDLQSTVEVELWMPDMGHGSSPVTVTQASDEAGRPLVGVYRITQVYFIMPGHWEIRVAVQGVAARELKAFEVMIDGAGSGGGHGGGHGHGGHHGH